MELSKVEGDLRREIVVVEARGLRVGQANLAWAGNLMTKGQVVQ